MTNIISLNKKQILDFQQNKPPYLMIDEATEIIPGKYSSGYKKLNSENNNTNLYTFWIYGWLGQYEDMHKNAIITNIDIESILEKENIRLPFFKKIKNHN